MANLDRIVSVSINLQTASIRQQSFSDMLVIGPHALSLSRVLIVTSADDLLSLGASEADPLYLAVADAFSQTSAIPQVYVGRLTIDTMRLSIDSVAAGKVYTVNLGWTQGGILMTAAPKYTAVAGDTATAVVAGLISAINAAGAPVTASNSSGLLTVVSGTPGTAFTLRPSGPMTLASTVSSESWTAALAACKTENDGWYGVVATTRVQSEILAIAAWVEAANRLYVTSVAEPGAIDASISSDTISLLKAGNFYRTAAFYHAVAATDWPEAAIMSKSFTKLPGSETWANQRLAAVSADPLTETQSIAVRNKNGNTFEPFRNDLSITQGGKVAGGEWIDVIRFRDWLAEQIKVTVFQLMVDNRIPYTDSGIRMIVSKIRQALDLGVTRGGIAPEEMDDDDKPVPSYTVSAPRSFDVSTNDKANRILNDVTWTARLAGAIHVVRITGTLTYQLGV